MNSPDYRQKIILEQIEQHGLVNVLDLAKTLNVSEMTIRRDLNELENIGLVRRTHGGAINAWGRSYEPPLLSRSDKNKEIKNMLGRYASEMVADGDSILLDVGSTIFEVAANLKEKQNITIITPSIPIASLFFDRSDVRLILPGGIVRPGERSMIGDFARKNLELMFVDRLFLGVGAIDSQAELTEYNLDDAAVKQVMIKNAKEIILVADSSKFEQIAFSFVAPLKVIRHLVTNEKPPEPLLNALKACNVNIHVVS